MKELSQNATILANKSASKAQPTRVRWKLFFVVFILVVVNFIDRTALSVAMPMIAQEFSLSPAFQGLILSAFFWSYALGQLPGGWLVDRFGPRVIMTVSTIGWGVFQAIAGWAVGGITLLLTRIGLGAMEAPLFPAAAKLNAAWLSAKEHARGAAIVDSGGPFGAAIGGLLISFLILALGSWRLTFFFVGVVTAALGYIAWRFFRNTPKEHPLVNPAELAIIENRASDQSCATDADKHMSRATLVAILFGRVGWTMMIFGIMTWGPSYLSHGRGLDLKELGWATFAMFFAGMAGSLVSGFLADRLQSLGWQTGLVYKLLLCGSGVFVILGFIALPSIADVGIAISVLCGTLFFLYFGSLYWSLPVLFAPKEQVGLVGSIMNMAGSVSGICVPIIAGFILQLTASYMMVLYFFAFCSVLYVISTFFIQFQKRG
ncbi:MFS transporter [Bartonella sp. LJL80]